MYQLIIVEDEKAIAQGIANSNPWHEWGFEVAGVCYNGEEAVEFIKEHPVDLVLSDIRMPKMDGVALMQHLNRYHPEIKIIILSGYNDFEYLQTAIRSGVTEYLLKPTDVDEFAELFQKVKQALDQRDQEREMKEKAEFTRRCNSLLRGYGYDEEAEEQEFYQAQADLIGVMVINLSGEDIREKKKYHKGQMAALEELNRLKGEEAIFGQFILNYEEKITGILRIDEDCGEDSIRDFARRLADKVQDSTGFELNCGISSFYPDFRMLPQCYEQAKCSAYQRIFLEEKQRVIFYRQIQESEFDYYQFAFDEEKILKYILNQERGNLALEIQNTFSYFRNHMVENYDYINQMSLEILFYVSRKLLKYNVRAEKLMKEHGCTYTDVFEREKLEEKEAFLLFVFDMFMEECQAQYSSSTKTRDLAESIRGIVDREYMVNGISLDYVAEKVRKSTAFISKIFKNEFECNFSTYITEKRLNHSLELLQDPSRKVYEISQDIGWADVSNYIKVFKKKYGVSPDEYRRLLPNRQV